jgi:DNA-binding beta-propeller fold protein YncE
VPFIDYFGGLSGLAVSSAGTVFALSNGGAVYKLHDSGIITGIWGSSGTGPNQFSSPYGVDIGSNGITYVADTANKRIQRLAADGSFLSIAWPQSYGLSSADYFANRIEIDSAGNRYYLLDSEILKCDSTGVALATIGYSGSGDGQLANPMGIALDKSGNIYVADTGNNRIEIFSSNGAYLRQFGTLGSDNGNLKSPWGVAVDALGNIYVADKGNSRIQKFTNSGTYVTAWGVNSSDGAFNEVMGIALDSSANVYITNGDSANGYRVQEFSSDGAFLRQWGTSGIGNGQFEYPQSLTVVGSYLYVADSVNNRIQKFSLEGSYVTQWSCIDVSDIAADSTGNIYGLSLQEVSKFTDTGAFLSCTDSSGVTLTLQEPKSIAVHGDRVYIGDVGRVIVYNLAGKYITQWGSALGDGPGRFDDVLGIAIDSSGYVYTLDGSKVQKFDSNGNYILQWGSKGSGDGQFNAASAITCYGNNVFVGDQVLKGSVQVGRLQKFELNGVFSECWNIGNIGMGIAALATDTSGYIYGTDGFNIYRISPTSGLLETWDYYNFCGRFSTPMDVAVDSFSNVYVTDGDHNRIQKFSCGGAFIDSWGSKGSGDIQFQEPCGIAIDSSNFVYVVDHDNYRIEKLTTSGDYVSSWGTGQGAGDYQFQDPKGIAVDSANGFVYIVDCGNNRIDKFTTSGVFQLHWGTLGIGDGEFQYPYDVAVDSSGNVYVADTSNHRIQKFAPDGTFLSKWGDSSTVGAPASVAIDHLGYVFVTTETSCTVNKFTETGTFIESWGSSGAAPGSFYNPIGIAVSLDNWVFVADYVNDNVQVFSNPLFPTPEAPWSAILVASIFTATAVYLYAKNRRVNLHPKIL